MIQDSLLLRRGPQVRDAGTDSELRLKSKKAKELKGLKLEALQRRVRTELLDERLRRVVRRYSRPKRTSHVIQKGSE